MENENRNDSSSNRPNVHQDSESPIEDPLDGPYGNDPIWKPTTHYLPSITSPDRSQFFNSNQAAIPILNYESPVGDQLYGSSTLGRGTYRNNPLWRPSTHYRPSASLHPSTVPNPTFIPRVKNYESPIEGQKCGSSTLGSNINKPLSRPASPRPSTSFSPMEYNIPIMDRKSPTEDWISPTSHYRPSTTRPQSAPAVLPHEDINPRMEENLDIEKTGAVTANERGTMSINLPYKKRVDISIDMSIRIIDPENHIVLALSANGSSAVLLHPMGRVHQKDTRVDILAYSHDGNNKYAKMVSKRISFTSDLCPVVYQLDIAGTRTTFDNFMGMTQDPSIPVFYEGSRHGPRFQDEAVSVLENALYIVDDNNTRTWKINNVTVTIEPDGSIRVKRNGDDYVLYITPWKSAAITTPSLHATASQSITPHLFVRSEDQRMHCDGAKFSVRNGAHSAGFDDNNRLRVFTY